MAQESKTPAPFRTSIGGQALIEGILMRGVDPVSYTHLAVYKRQERKSSEAV